MNREKELWWTKLFSDKFKLLWVNVGFYLYGGHSITQCKIGSYQTAIFYFIQISENGTQSVFAIILWIFCAYFIWKWCPRTAKVMGRIPKS